MKKVIVLFLTAILVLTGCQNKTTTNPNGHVVGEENAQFSETLDQMLIDLFSEDDFGINFSFENPENYGIEQGLYTVGFTSQSDYEAWYAYEKEAITALKTFADQDLSYQQQIDRDALIDYFEKDYALKAYYEYEVGGSNLGSLLSTNAQLSVYLDVFAFRTELDVQGYINMMITLPSYFQDYVNLEKQRQTNGTGFSQEELDDIITQAKDTVAAITDSYFLIASFNTRIDAVTFLSESEKNDYKAQNEEALKNQYKQAYQLLIDELSTIEGGDLIPLASKPNGKAYYEALLQKETGSSNSVTEVISFLNDQETEVLTKLRALLSKYPTYESLYLDPDYPSFNNAEEMLSNLVKTVQESGDFPATGEFKYEIRSVDESMEDSSSPAFYFTPTVDYSSTEEQFIYFNGDYSDSLLSTAAHEGFPGHMYQFNYFLGLDAHPIRSVLTYSANAEAWAVYAENYAMKYYFDDPDLAEFMYAYNKLGYLYYAQFDIGINYLGWTEEQFAENATQMFNMDDEAIHDLYLHMVANPTNTVMYYISNLYLADLKEKFIEEMGDDYTDYAFHEAFLRAGSTSFDVISKYLEYYIEEQS